MRDDNDASGGRSPRDERVPHAPENCVSSGPGICRSWRVKGRWVVGARQEHADRPWSGACPGASARIRARRQREEERQCRPIVHMHKEGREGRPEAGRGDPRRRNEHPQRVGRRPVGRGEGGRVASRGPINTDLDEPRRACQHGVRESGGEAANARRPQRASPEEVCKRWRPAARRLHSTVPKKHAAIGSNVELRRVQKLGDARRAGRRGNARRISAPHIRDCPRKLPHSNDRPVVERSKVRGQERLLCRSRSKLEGGCEQIRAEAQRDGRSESVEGCELARVKRLELHLQCVFAAESEDPRERPGVHCRRIQFSERYLSQSTQMAGDGGAEGATTLR